jgi:transposase
MSKKDEAKHRARYTLEFKLEAVRLVKAGQEASVTARVLGVPKQTLSSWVRLAAKGELQSAGDRPVSAEQMELARLRAELARVKMERDILKKATAYFASLSETLCVRHSMIRRSMDATQTKHRHSGQEGAAAVFQ